MPLFRPRRASRLSSSSSTQQHAQQPSPSLARARWLPHGLMLFLSTLILADLFLLDVLQDPQRLLIRQQQQQQNQLVVVSNHNDKTKKVLENGKTTTTTTSHPDPTGNNPNKQPTPVADSPAATPKTSRHLADNTNNNDDEEADDPSTPEAIKGLNRDDLWEHYQCDSYLSYGEEEEEEDDDDDDENNSVESNTTDTTNTTNTTTTNTTSSSLGFERPVDHSAIWRTMRQTYLNVFAPHNDSLRHTLLMATTQNRRYHNDSNIHHDGNMSNAMNISTALQVPYSVRQAPGGKGLGLFAETNVPNGTKVYDTEHGGGQVRFTQGRDVRRFMHELSVLSSEQQELETAKSEKQKNKNKNDKPVSQPMANYMACMVLQCSTVESNNMPAAQERLLYLKNLTSSLLANDKGNSSDVSNENSTNATTRTITTLQQQAQAMERKRRQLSQLRRKLMRRETYIAVDLDDGCFANGADGGADSPNVGGPNDEQCCDYATNDISAGNELVWSYGSYSFSQGWRWFGL